MIQVNMQAGDDAVVKIVLKSGQMLGEVNGVVIENQTQAPGYLFVGIFPLLLHQGSADQIAYGLGTVLIAVLRVQIVKLPQESFIQGYA
jgi:hypothetical protein